jgi:hypothetical protein
MGEGLDLVGMEGPLRCHAAEAGSTRQSPVNTRHLHSLTLCLYT